MTNPVPRDSDFRPHFFGPRMERVRVLAQVKRLVGGHPPFGAIPKPHRTTKRDMMRRAARRRMNVAWMRDSGLTHKEVGELLGVSPGVSARVWALVRHHRRRAFSGGYTDWFGRWVDSPLSEREAYFPDHKRRGER